jgi:hypothetical protein
MRLVLGTLAPSFLLTLPQPQPAGAAWLALQGGEVLRTQGDWKVDGSQVLYTTMQRQFTSIPLSEVDVTRSETLNQVRPANLHAEALVDADRPRPVLTVITDGMEAGKRRAIKKSAPVSPSAVKRSVVVRSIEKSPPVIAERPGADEERRMRTEERRVRRAEALRRYATQAGGSD